MMTPLQWLQTVLFNKPKPIPPLPMGRGWSWQIRPVAGFDVVGIDEAGMVLTFSQLRCWHLVCASGKAWPMLPALAWRPGVAWSAWN